MAEYSVTPSDSIGLEETVAKTSEFGRSVAESWSAGSQFNGYPSDAVATDYFGARTAIDGNWAALVGGEHVWMYLWDNGHWEKRQCLTPSDWVSTDGGVYSVDIHGDTVIFGYAAADPSGTSSGAAYVYTCTNYVWSQQQKLAPTDPAANKFFGSAVAVCGDTAAVGAYGDSTNRGAVYVFTRSAGVWTQADKLQASDGVSGNYLCYERHSLAICKQTGTSIIAGATNHTHSGKPSNSGAAYVWVYSGSWSQQQELFNSSAAVNDYFGDNVHIDGDTCAVTARGATYPETTVFTRSGGTWTEVQKIEATLLTMGGQCQTVVVSEATGWLFIGWPYSDQGYTNAGKVVAYKKIGSSYIEQAYWLGVNSNRYLGQGLGMSSDGTRVTIGASANVLQDAYIVSFGSDLRITEVQAREDSKTTIALSADSVSAPVDVVYRTAELQARAGDPTRTLTKAGYTGFDIASSGTVWPVAMDGDSVCYVADPEYNTGEGRVFVYTRSGTTWSYARTIANPDAPAKTYFGQGLWADGGSVAIGAPNKTVGGYANAGTVWVYINDGATQEQELPTPIAQANQYYGYRTRVYIAGDMVCVGNPNRSYTGWYMGCTHTWTRSTGVWTEQAQLQGYWSGHSYASGRMGLCGTTGTAATLVSVRNDGTAAAQYRWNAGASTWTFVRLLTVAHGVQAMAVGPNIIAYTMLTASPPAHNSVSIYRLENDDWVESLLDSQKFGLGYTADSSSQQRVAVSSEGYVIIGDIRSNVGYVKILKEEGNIWLQKLELTSDVSGALVRLAIGGSGDTLYIAGSEASVATGDDFEIVRISVAIPDLLTDDVTGVILGAPVERSASDEEEVTDDLSITTFMSYLVGINDSADVEDLLAEETISWLELIDAVSMLDAEARELLAERVLDEDQQEVTDSELHDLWQERGAADDETVTDGEKVELEQLRRAVDEEATTYTISKLYDAHRPLLDQPVVGDEALVEKVSSGLIDVGDGISEITDLVQATVTLSGTAQDAETVTDALLASMELERRVEREEVVSDSSLQTLELWRIPADLAAVADSTLLARSLLRIIEDSEAVEDRLGLTTDLGIVDLEYVADLLRASLSMLVRCSEAALEVQTTDTAVRSAATSKAFTDTLTLVEQVDAVRIGPTRADDELTVNDHAFPQLNPPGLLQVLLDAEYVDSGTMHESISGLGYSVAAGGDYMVVGAPWSNDPDVTGVAANYFVGAALIYKWDNTAKRFSLVTTLYPPTSPYADASGGRFGAAVAISEAGDCVFVSAPWEPSAGCLPQSIGNPSITASSLTRIAILNGEPCVVGVSNTTIYQHTTGTSWASIGSITGSGGYWCIYAANSTVYVGTVSTGYVYRHDGGTTWTSLGRCGSETQIFDLHAIGSQLYAIASSGYVYRYDGGTTWTSIGRPSVDSTRLTSSGSYLYANGAGVLYKYDGGWSSVATCGTDGLAPAVCGLDGNVYVASTQVGASTYKTCTIWKYDGVDMINIGTLPSYAVVSFFHAIGTQLYAGTSFTRSYNVHRYDGGTTWTQIYDAGWQGPYVYGSVSAVKGMASYGSTLYIVQSDTNYKVVKCTGSFSRAGKVYRYDRAGTVWSSTPDQIIERGTEAWLPSSGNGRSYEYFGTGLAFDGETLAIGWGRHEPFPYTGAVSLYANSGGSWALIETKEPPEPTPRLYYGCTQLSNFSPAARALHLYDNVDLPGRTANRALVIGTNNYELAYALRARFDVCTRASGTWDTPVIARPWAETTGLWWQYVSNGHYLLDVERDTVFGSTGIAVNLHTMAEYDGAIYCVGIGRPEFSQNSLNGIYRYDGVDGTGRHLWTLCSSLEFGTWNQISNVNGELYACSGNKVYKYTGGTTWTDCGAPYGATTVGGARFTWHDSAMYVTTTSPRVCRYDGGTSWTDCGEPGSSGTVYSMHSHGGSLYAARGTTVYRFDGGITWTSVGAPAGGLTATIYCMEEFDGDLYAATSSLGSVDGCGVYHYDGGTSWTRIGSPTPADPSHPYWNYYIIDLLEFAGELYANAPQYKRIYKYTGGTSWETVGGVTPYGSGLSYDMVACAGALYVTLETTMAKLVEVADGVTYGCSAPVRLGAARFLTAIHMAADPYGSSIFDDSNGSAYIVDITDASGAEAVCSRLDLGQPREWSGANAPLMGVGFYGTTFGANAAGTRALVAAPNQDGVAGSSGVCVLLNTAEGDERLLTSIYPTHHEQVELAPLQPRNVIPPPYYQEDFQGFGEHFSQAGDWLAVGCVYGTAPNMPYGSGYVSMYKWVDDQLVLMATLTAPVGEAEDGMYFGSQVALDPAGSTLMVGAGSATVSSQANAGKVYRFDRSGDVWAGTPVEIVTHPSPAADHGFGANGLAFDGTHLLVQNTKNSPLTGVDAVQCYELSGGSYVWTQELQPASPMQGEGFGQGYYGNGIALRNGVAVFLRGILSGVTPGCYVFEYTGGSWVEQTLLLAAVDQDTAMSIAFVSDTAFVFSTWSDAWTTPCAVHMVSASGGWQLTQTLVGPLTYLGEHGEFGTSLAVSGDGSQLLVGAMAWEDRNDDHSWAGAAFLYDITGTTIATSYRVRFDTWQDYAEIGGYQCGFYPSTGTPRLILCSSDNSTGADLSEGGLTIYELQDPPQSVTVPGGAWFGAYAAEFFEPVLGAEYLVIGAAFFLGTGAVFVYRISDGGVLLTLILPSAQTLGGMAGARFPLDSVYSGVQVLPTGADLIDGEASKTLSTPGETVSYITIAQGLWASLMRYKPRS